MPDGLSFPRCYTARDVHAEAPTPVYSHSRISSFANCPLQYRYRYIDKLKSPVEGVEAFVGKIVHEVLEALYADLGRARASSAEDYTALFRNLWRQRATSSLRIVRENMTPEAYRDLGVRCIENFFRQNHPFEGAEVLGCETQVEFNLDPEGRYRMQGYIDRIDRVAPGVIEIHDYKTGSLPRERSLRFDRQLTLYEIAVRDRWAGVKEVRHVWHYLAHARKFVQRRAPEDLIRTKLATIRAIQDIEATVVFPPRPGPLCSWCEYNGVCPEFRPKTARPLPELEPGSLQYRLFPLS